MTSASPAPTIFCSPGAPAGERYGLVFGAWDDPDQLWLLGFATAFDAWCFAVAHTMEDPAPQQVSREWTYNQPEPEPVQRKMF